MACWYDRDGITRIRKDARRALKLFQQAKSSDSSSSCTSRGQPECCVQGLEGFTKSGKEQKLRRRQDAINVVFDTQEKQYDRFGCITNTNAIANAYKMVTEESERIARVGGIVSELQLCVLLKADQRRDELDYFPLTISAVRCELAFINESRKLSDQVGWMNVVSQVA
jgi:hypothetical protein